MTLPKSKTDREYKSYVEDADGNVALRTTASLVPVGDIPVEIKDATTDTRAVVKSDGTNNALVVTQNTVPTTTVPVPTTEALPTAAKTG